jgi:serine/threonine protein phosphatase PrpC
MTSQQQ